MDFDLDESIDMKPPLRLAVFHLLSGLADPYNPFHGLFIPRRSLSMVIGLGLCLTVGAFDASAQSGAERGIFHDEQRVTAVDLLVTYERAAVREWAAGQNLPAELTADDFEIRVDGQAAEIVSMGLPGEFPWHFLLYFDAVLTTPETMTWAATLLSEQLDLLLAHGQVAVVLADPQPRWLLGATDDRDDVARVLAQLALQPTASGQLQQLRDEFLTLAATEPTDQDIIELLAEEERRIVRRRHDQLTTWLADDAAQPATDRRALLYVSDGFDAHPESFYEGIASMHDPPTPEDAPPHSPNDSADLGSGDGSGSADLDSGDGSADLETGNDGATSLALSQVLASYGWVALPMLPPEPELLTRGLRLGKFLIKPIGPRRINIPPEDTAQGDQYGLRSLVQRVGQVLLFGLQVKYEEHRDVDKARAYLDLARALHGQGKLEDAADAYEKALFHFSGDPRTAELQAEAMAGVGDMMAELGDRQGAQRAYENALTLDPGMVETVGTGIAFSDPATVLRPLATATVGRLVRQAEDLQGVFDVFPRKLRLTYQLDALPSGKLQDIEVVCRREKVPPSHPRWTRSGTPEVVTEARLRQLLEAGLNFTALGDGEALVGGELPPPTFTTRLDDRGRLDLVLRRPPPPVLDDGAVPANDLPQRPLDLRISFASMTTEGEQHIVHRRHAMEQRVETLSTAGDLDPEARFWAVVVEGLVSGSWQARVIDPH